MSGEIGAGHANELIKLDHEAQEKILPHIVEKSTSVVRGIVKDIEEMGVEGAIEKSINAHPLTKEMVAFKNNTKKLNRLAQKLMMSDDGYEGVEVDNALKEAHKLSKNLNEFITFFEGGRYDKDDFEAEETPAESNDNFDSDFIPPSAEESVENYSQM